MKDYPHSKDWPRTGMTVTINGEPYVHIENVERVAKAHHHLTSVAVRLQGEVNEHEHAR